MGNWDVELDQYKDMNEEMLIKQVIKYFKRSLESSIRAYNNPNIYGEIKDLSEFNIKSLALFEIYAYQMAIAALEAEPSVDAIRPSVIEDIKAEIKSLYAYYGDGSGWEESRNITLNEVMKIIDKHTSGKEQA